MLVSARSVHEAVRRERRRASLLTSALLGALAGSLALWTWLVLS